MSRIAPRLEIIITAIVTEEERCTGTNVPPPIIIRKRTQIDLTLIPRRLSFDIASDN